MRPQSPFALNAGFCALTIIQRIDLRVAKKEDLAFTAPFELRATRNDCMSILPRLGRSVGYDVAFADVHAFLAWFDISFDCTHKMVSFSTGPHAKYTHWK